MAKKGNKEMLAKINYSWDVVKDIKDGKTFTQEEKEEMFERFTGLDKSNNSYFTSDSIVQFIHDLLDIRTESVVADLSAGIGSMFKPLIKENGEFKEGIQGYLYELDSNTSRVLNTIWENYNQVNTYGNFDSLARQEEIPNDTFNFIISNPPFSGSAKSYWTEYHHNKNGTAKNINLADAFVHLSVNKLKLGGYLALILPYGHLYKSQGGTDKLRGWLKNNVALKGIFPLDSSTFENSGVQGTKVGTVLCIYQKGVPQNEVFYGDLFDKEDLENEMKSLAHQFQLFLNGDYDLVYESDSASGLHGKFNEQLAVWIG